MQSQWLFLGNLMSHWIFLMGGIAGVIISAIAQVRKKPWASAFWVATVICLLVAADRAWQDEHRNAQIVISEKASQVALSNTCQSDVRVQKALYTAAQGLVESQRETLDSQRQSIDKQQQSISSQQGSINSCVVSLGKLNPKVREEIEVIQIPIATTDNNGRFVGLNTFLKKFMTLLLVTVNEPELRFNGTLRCEKPFQILSPPAVPGTSQTVFSTIAPPHRISDNEFEISASTNGTDWSPAHPAYMIINSDGPSTGACSFIPRPI